MLFNELGLRAELLRAVEENGYREATPIQQQAIPAVLAGRDVMGLAQTGTGKTAAFMLPILQRLTTGPLRRHRVLVVAPGVDRTGDRLRLGRARPRRFGDRARRLDFTVTATEAVIADPGEGAPTEDHEVEA